MFCCLLRIFILILLKETSDKNCRLFDWCSDAENEGVLTWKSSEDSIFHHFWGLIAISHAVRIEINWVDGISHDICLETI